MRRAFAPGRVNLIGEHTDYNGGLALPFAIDRGVTVTVEPLEEPRLEVDPAAEAFARGVAAELGVRDGVRVRIESDLPVGAGLSSSAALCVALALALGGEPEDRVELAKLCSRVENEWVGAQTGLLDQLAVLLGEEGHALRIDFRDLDVRRVPLELGDWALVTMDSGASHDLATGGYNERRRECAEAWRLREAGEPLPDPLDRRVRHVESENARVEETVAALGEGDLGRVGALLDASHASLRDDYDASVPAVESAVRAMHDAGAAGARMVGGGFGGSVLALFPPGAAPPMPAVAVRPGPAARLR